MPWQVMQRSVSGAACKRLRGDLCLAIDTDAVRTVFDAFERGIDSVQFGTFTCVQCKFQIALDIDLSPRIFGMLEMLG